MYKLIPLILMLLFAGCSIHIHKDCECPITKEIAPEQNITPLPYVLPEEWGGFTDGCFYDGCNWCCNGMCTLLYCGESIIYDDLIPFNFKEKK